MAENTSPKKKTTKTTKKTTAKTSAAKKAPAKAAAAKESTSKKLVKDEKNNKVPFLKSPKIKRFRKNFPAAVKTTNRGVWAIVGLALIVGSIISFVNDEPLTHTLNLTDQTQPTATSQSTAPAEPTQEQLDCVANELGEERFLELRQGAPPSQEEAAVVDQCLSS